MVQLNAQNLPWVLLGLTVTALLAVFYAMLRGAIVPKRVSDQLRESDRARAEIAEAGIAANTDSVRTLVDSVEKLTVLAETQDKVLRALRDTAQRQARSRGGS